LGILWVRHGEREEYYLLLGVMETSGMDRTYSYVHIWDKPTSGGTIETPF
jgi:hypothetical protein